MGYYLGIDLGTSATKTLVMDASGRVLADASAAHGVQTPRPTWSEQSPQEWWASTVAAVRTVLRKARIDGSAIAGIGLSGQMHGLVCLDGRGRPLRPAIIWNDQRSADEAALIERRVGGPAELIKLVGNVAMTSFTLTKLLWVQRHQKRLFRQIRQVLLPKDYVRYRLTGRYAGDVSDMSGTLLLDPRRRDWSAPMLDRFGIDRAILPDVLESHEVAGELSAEAAGELGLAAGTPVVAGAGDQPAGAVGNGIVAPGMVSAVIGTSGVLYVHSPKYLTDPRGRVQTFCSAVAGEYCMFGCVLAAGGSLQWFRNALCEDLVAQARRQRVDPYVLLTGLAQDARPGCGGVFYLPYLTGERTPHADPRARACFVGITAPTTRGDLIRAVMEGATFAMNDALTILRQRGLRPKEIRLSGGGARSAFWRQLQADIYGARCATVAAQEGPAYGAAILAAVGTGAYPSVPAACRAIVKRDAVIDPDPASKRRYAVRYRQYVRLYPALKPEFARIAEME